MKLVFSVIQSTIPVGFQNSISMVCLMILIFLLTMGQHTNGLLQKEDRSQLPRKVRDWEYLQLK